MTYKDIVPYSRNKLFLRHSTRILSNHNYMVYSSDNQNNQKHIHYIFVQWILLDNDIYHLINHTIYQCFLVVNNHNFYNLFCIPNPRSWLNNLDILDLYYFVDKYIFQYLDHKYRRDLYILHILKIFKNFVRGFTIWKKINLLLHPWSEYPK